MTIHQFRDELDAAYGSNIPAPQLVHICRMVEQAMVETGYRHFLDYIIENCERRPNAATVKGLLRDYIDYSPKDEHDTGDCRDCNGWRFIQSRFTASDGREYTQSAMCHCHAGYGQ